MASLDSLPADQRAVLQLVLQRGRSYDDIARMLSIDRAAVRERALTAFDLLGPQTGVPDQRRALITDYLLGQLPERVAEQTRSRLAESPSERAWARVLASELAPLTSGPLPEIPAEGVRASAVTPSAEVQPAPETEPRRRAGAAAAPVGAVESEPSSGLAPPSRHEPSGSPPDKPRQTGPLRSGRSSRPGGLVVILAGVAAVIVVVVLLVSSGGGSNKKRHTTTAAHSTTAASTTASSSTAAHVIAQINLTPTAAGSKTAGIAEVLKEGANNGVAIVAQNVPPNTTKPPNAYAVWLYNSPTDAHILGFVNPGVTSTGRLSTAGGLPANASHYKNLIITVETKANPTTPGSIILQGVLTGLK